MATTKEVVELLFNADYKGQPEMRKLKKDVASLADDLSAGVGAVATFSTAMLGLEAAALGVSIGLAKSGVEAAGKFNDQFNEISTLIDITGHDLEVFKQGIRSYASESTASIEQIQSATYNAISAGIEYSSSLDFLRESEKLSVAGKAELNSVVQVLTGSLNAYGASADDAGGYSDVLFNTVRLGVTSIPELATSLGQVTGLAASLNIPFDELNAVIATLTANGLNTSTAISAIKGALTGIIKPSSAAADAAKELGIGFDYASLQSKGFSGLMQDIAESSGDNKEAVTKLFGSIEGLNAALSLTSESGAATFLDKLEEIKDSAGATDVAFLKMKDNASLIKQTLQNNIELTLGAIGEPLLDEFKDIDKAITAIFGSVRASIESETGLGVVVDAVEGIAGTVSQIINNMALNMDSALNQADLGGFVRAFELIDDALKSMDLVSPEGLAKALEAVGKAFEGLTEFSVNAGSVLAELLSAFGSMVSLLSNVDGETIAVAGSIGGLAIAVSAVSAILSPFLAVLMSLKKLGGVVGAIGTAASLSASGTALAGVAAAMGKLGVAGAAVGAGFFAGGWLVEGIDNLTGWSEKASESTVAGDELNKMLENFRKETGNANATMQDYGDHLRAKRDAEKASSQAVDGLASDQAKLNDTMNQATDWAALDALSEVGQVTFDAQGNMVSFNEALKDNSTTSKKASGELEIFGQVAKDTDLALKTIESFKPVFDFQTAKVEADAQQVKSIMEALGHSTKAVSESLGAAFGIISSGEFANLNIFDQADLMSSIREQTEAQAELAKGQANVANAQAEYTRSKTARMDSGGALIQIDGTRLEPQLEAFMMQVLQAIQVRAVEDQADFLLGVSQL